MCQCQQPPLLLIIAGVDAMGAKLTRHAMPSYGMTWDGMAWHGMEHEREDKSERAVDSIAFAILAGFLVESSLSSRIFHVESSRRIYQVESVKLILGGRWQCSLVAKASQPLDLNRPFLVHR